MQVPFVDLTETTSQIKDSYLTAVKDLLDKGSFVLTEEVGQFERAWAKTIGVSYCVGVSSGADALYLSLLALGIGSGDEVITQGNAYNASVVAILRTGAVPRFVDIDPDKLTINARKIKSLINEKTKAILPVHLYGQMNDMAAISEIAHQYNLFVIEDCAQAHLATFDGRLAGNFGDVAGFSFYPTKNLGTFGDGGAVVTDNQALAEKIRLMRNLGEVAKNDHKLLGFNMRLDAIQAVCLNLKLPFLVENTEKRQKVAAYYDQLLQDVETVIPLGRDERAVHVFHLYVVKIRQGNRDELMHQLAQVGIQTSVHYPIPVYRQPFYDGVTNDCSVTDQTADQILSLPLFVGITSDQQRYVIDQLKKLTQ